MRPEGLVEERPLIQQQALEWKIEGPSPNQKAGLYSRVNRLTGSLGILSAHQGWLLKVCQLPSVVK